MPRLEAFLLFSIFFSIEDSSIAASLLSNGNFLILIML